MVCASCGCAPLTDFDSVWRCGVFHQMAERGLRSEGQTTQRRLSPHILAPARLPAGCIRVSSVHACVTFISVWYPSSSASMLVGGMLFCPDGQLLVSMTTICRLPLLLVTLNRSAPLHWKCWQSERRRLRRTALSTAGLRWW